MKVSLNRMSDFVLPVFWGGQGLILCLTNSNIFFVVGAILVLLSIFVSILRNTHCMPYGLIVILPPHTNQTELQ